MPGGGRQAQGRRWGYSADVRHLATGVKVRYLQDQASGLRYKLGNGQLSLLWAWFGSHAPVPQSSWTSVELFLVRTTGHSAFSTWTGAPGLILSCLAHPLCVHLYRVRFKFTQFKMAAFHSCFAQLYMTTGDAAKQQAGPPTVCVTRHKDRITTKIANLQEAASTVEKTRSNSACLHHGNLRVTPLNTMELYSWHKARLDSGALPLQPPFPRSYCLWWPVTFYWQPIPYAPSRGSSYTVMTAT